MATTTLVDDARIIRRLQRRVMQVGIG